MQEKGLELVRGSRYNVRFGKTEETTGVFKGYSMIGNETAVVIDSGGTAQFIMAGHIISITLLESGSPEKARKDDPGVYYG